MRESEPAKAKRNEQHRGPQKSRGCIGDRVPGNRIGPVSQPRSGASQSAARQVSRRVAGFKVREKPAMGDQNPYERQRGDGQYLVGEPLGQSG